MHLSYHFFLYLSYHLPRVSFLSPSSCIFLITVLVYLPYHLPCLSFLSPSLCIFLSPSLRIFLITFPVYHSYHLTCVYFVSPSLRIFLITFCVYLSYHFLSVSFSAEKGNRLSVRLGSLLRIRGCLKFLLLTPSTSSLGGLFPQFYTLS